MFFNREKVSKEFKRNQKLARHLVFFFTYTMDNKHLSIINIFFNKTKITLDSQLPSIEPVSNSESDEMKIVFSGYMEDIILNHSDERILKKMNKIFRKNKATYQIRVEDSKVVLYVSYINK